MVVRCLATEIDDANDFLTCTLRGTQFEGELLHRFDADPGGQLAIGIAHFQIGNVMGDTHEALR